MTVNFHVTGLDGISWKTAQSTGALACMPYSEAEEYAGIYDSQAVLDSAEEQATRDAMITLVPFVNLSHDHPEPSPQQAAEIKHNMEIQQGQLLLVDAALQGLEKTYQVFLTSQNKLTTSSLWSHKPGNRPCRYCQQ